MTLIKSISGIRGTIGGKSGDSLSPLDTVKFTTAFVSFLKERSGKKKLKIVVGRDARLSGEMVNSLVCGTLQSMGADVYDLGLSTTPTVEMAVMGYEANGGIILTASHNPKQWNALKLLNERGEFLSAADGEKLLLMANDENVSYVDIDDIGEYNKCASYIDEHIDAVLSLDLVDVEAIRKAGFRVAVDAVNSTGGVAIPKLLKALGVETIYELNCEPTGHFAHNPEPIPENLVDISELVKARGADLGIVVDPDVDRLALVCQDGMMFGEEYTLVAVADYVLSCLKGGNTVSNLSSSRALKDITLKYGSVYTPAAVGEVNVVEMMKKMNCVIGGEGNGGVIYPELHYGRDALVGVALFLTLLAKSGKIVSELRAGYPKYVISKNRIDLEAGTDVDMILKKIADKFKEFPQNDIDGIRIDYNEKEWVHLRKSNTEPIIRIYAESETKEMADVVAQRIIDVVDH